MDEPMFLINFFNHILRIKLIVIPRLDWGIYCLELGMHLELDCPVKPDNDNVYSNA